MVIKSRILKYLFPTLLTFLRLAAAPLFYYSFFHSSCIYATIIILLSGLTDVLDGFIARKLDASSIFGAYFDVVVDFILILVVFIAFYQKLWYDFLVFFAIAIPFLFFIVTSQNKKPIYDPIGKHLGTFLMFMIVITLCIPFPVVRKTITCLLVVYSLISVATRCFFLLKFSAKPGKSYSLQT